jgi:PREDICTED: similar to esterase
LLVQKPTPFTSWRGVLIADKAKDGCPQFDSFGKVYGYEDCLFLNVYSPIPKVNIAFLFKHLNHN